MACMGHTRHLVLRVCPIMRDYGRLRIASIANHASRYIKRSKKSGVGTIPHNFQPTEGNECGTVSAGQATPDVGVLGFGELKLGL